MANFWVNLLIFILRLVALITGGFFLVIAGMAMTEKDKFWIASALVGILIQSVTFFPIRFKLKLRLLLWLIGACLLIGAGILFPLFPNLLLIFSGISLQIFTHPPLTEKLQKFFKSKL